MRIFYLLVVPLGLLTLWGMTEIVSIKSNTESWDRYYSLPAKPICSDNISPVESNSPHSFSFQKAPAPLSIFTTDSSPLILQLAEEVPPNQQSSEQQEGDEVIPADVQDEGKTDSTTGDGTEQVNQAITPFRFDPYLWAHSGKYDQVFIPPTESRRKYDLNLRLNRRGYFNALTRYLTYPDIVYPIQSYWRSLNDFQYPQIFDLQVWNEMTKKKAQEEKLISTEKEEGLVPDIELPGSSELKISGRKMVSMGFTKQNYDYYGYGERPPGGDIQMNQELQLRVEGTVARKTTVNIDYDDTRENENRNLISVVYKGDKDEVVQEAAFGDISLSLPSTEFLSYSSSKSVFGGRTNLKLGPLNWMTIASREKGKVEKENFSGSSEFTSQYINDTAYAHRRYFRLNSEFKFFKDGDTQVYKIRTDSAGNPYVELYYYAGGGMVQGVTNYEIFAYPYYDGGGWTSGETHYSAGQDPRYPEPPPEYSFTSLFFQKLYPSTDYSVNVDTGVITLNKTLESSDTLVVAYQMADGDNNPLYSVGYNGDEVNYSDMKLLRENGLGGFYQKYEQVNVYPLGGQNIQRQDFLLKLMDTSNSEVDPVSGQTYLKIYGLDNDGIIGIDPQFLDYGLGLVMFPDDSIQERLPFDYDDNDLVEGFDAYQPDDTNHKMQFYVEFKAVRPSYILKPNIIPGSETVKINGVVQVRDQDYWIDYDSGFLEFFTTAINDPDANIEITYEYRPFFAELSKTLAGTRMELELSPESHLGATFLGEWTSKPSRGEIPSIEGAPTIQNVLDTDLKLSYHPEFMTKLADSLPLVRTLQPSSLEIEGELARSYLNPNIVDKAKIDDMEGNKIAPGLPMRKTAWMPGSMPGAMGGTDYFEESRVLLNIDEVQLLEDTIDRNLTKDLVWCLRINGLPEDPGQNSRWGTIMRNISQQGLDFQEKRYEYLEMLVKFPADAQGLMHINLGEVSEDSDTDNVLDTEDTDQPVPDGILQQSEDIGIEFNNDVLSSENTHPGNIDTVLGADNNVLDTEDLNQNLKLDMENNYYTYTVDISQVNSDNPPDYVTRKMLDDNGNWTRWVTIRFPLNLDDKTADGNYGMPDPTKIKHIRVWFEAVNDGDFSPVDNIYIANIAPVGNRWYDAQVDPVLGHNWASIEDISNRSDDRYVPIKQEYDENNILKKESSLSLRCILSNWEDVGWQGDQDNPSTLQTTELPYTDAAKQKLLESGKTLAEVLGSAPGAGDGILNTEDKNHNGILDPGEDVGWGWRGTGENNGKLDSEDEIEAFTEYVNEYRPDNYTKYKYITTRIWQAESENNNEIFFLRFGSDIDNYYEYFVKVSDAPQDLEAPAGWKLVKADIFHFLELQSKYATELANHETINDGNYRIKGNPQLINIVELVVGVRTTDPMNGKTPNEIWINDIQLESSDREMGWARRFKMDLSFADLVSVGGYYRDIDGDFQSLGTLETDKRKEVSKEVHSTLHLEKFMPLKWSITMPISGSWNKSTSYTEDRYDPTSSRYTFGTNLSYTKKLDWAFKRKLLPSLSLGYSQSRTDNLRYERVSKVDTYSSTLGYDIPLKFPVMPTNITANFKRSVSRVIYSSEVITDPDESFVTDSLTTSARFEPIRALEFRPGFSYRLIWDRMLNTESSYSEGYSMQVNMTRKQGFRPTASYSSTYTENIVEGTGKLDVSNNTTISTSSPLEMSQLLGSEKSLVSSLSISPSYSLTRSTSFDDLSVRPDIDYRVGYNTGISGLTPKSSRMRHSFSLSNKYRPFQYLAKNFGTKYSNWDCLATTFGITVAHETVSATSSIAKSRSVTFPDIDIRLDGTKNFPIFSGMLLRSTVVVGYRKKNIDVFGISHSTDHNPYFSWRASWSDTFRTRFDLDYDALSIKELDFGAVRKDRTLKPAITINYDLKMPSGFNIPVLGKIFRFRNELNFQGEISYTRMRTENSGEDSYNRWDASISAGYYITTNLHLTLTTAYANYKNLTRDGRNYSTISFFGTAEAVF